MINVIVASDPRYKVNKKIIQDTVESTLKLHRISKQVEVEVNIVGDRKMHELNKTYRGMDYIPEVLTFVFEDPSPQDIHHFKGVGFISSPDKVLRLGSILISYTQALDDAAVEGKSVEEEICFLVEHGTKHLLGLHHE